jgi:hypothetical protein
MRMNWGIWFETSFLCFRRPVSTSYQAGDLTFRPTPRAVWATALILSCVLFFNDRPATADTILFNDLSDNVSITPLSSRITNLTCGTNALFESCVFTLLPPSLSATLLSPGSMTLLIAEAPGPSNASDEIALSIPLQPGGGVGFNFFSDVDMSTTRIADCNTPPVVVLCNVFENGAVQTAFQLFWSNGTIDTIQFQSDVPQPASWLLLLGGLATLAPSIWRKSRARIFSDMDHSAAREEGKKQDSGDPPTQTLDPTGVLEWPPAYSHVGLRDASKVTTRTPSLAKGHTLMGHTLIGQQITTDELSTPRMT